MFLCFPQKESKMHQHNHLDILESSSGDMVENKENTKYVHNNRIDMNLRELALYIGYDLNSESDIQRLIKNLDWVEREREKEDRSRNLRPALIVGGTTVTISAILTTFVTGVLIPFIAKHFGY